MAVWTNKKAKKQNDDKEELQQNINETNLVVNDLLMADDVQAQINELTGVINEIIMGGE